MIIKVTIFNDPSRLGVSKKRQKIKENYAFPVHDGFSEYMRTSKNVKTYIGKGRQSTGHSAYTRRKTWTVPGRKGINYFGRAIQKYESQIPHILLDYCQIDVINNRLELNMEQLKAGFRHIANLIKEEAMSIIEHEAKDTGDLMSSVSTSMVEVLMEDV